MSVQVDTGTRRRLAERSGSRCEICGLRRAAQAHHRCPRALGGTTSIGSRSLANLLHLCEVCHMSVEARRAIAYDMGWLVRHHDDPASVVVVYRGRNVRLAADGSVVFEAAA